MPTAFPHCSPLTHTKAVLGSPVVLPYSWINLQARSVSRSVCHGFHGKRISAECVSNCKENSLNFLSTVLPKAQPREGHHVGHWGTSGWCLERGVGHSGLGPEGPGQASSGHAVVHAKPKAQGAAWSMVSPGQCYRPRTVRALTDR